MRKLALLDVDGTLTDTVEVDLECFLQALGDLFGFGTDPAGYDWDAIEHATDPGLLYGAFEQRAGREPTAGEREAFLRHFLHLLRRAAGRTPRAFAAVTGAGRLLAALRASREWDLAIATGCYLESALLKLELAGLEVASDEVTSASEAMSREEIFGRALGRSIAGRGDVQAVLVGDGTWDGVTARKLGLPFVGVARGRKARGLESLGAVAVVPDFSDLDKTFELLERACE